ncbi:MAG: DUF3185 family protein [Planctomycetes bacterium]|nr:DUF3185 family protein [Planctomycetota bacterium]
MKTPLGLLLTASGAGLLYVGYQKHNEVGESVGRFFTGTNSTETKLFLLGGVVCVLIGLGLLGMVKLTKNGPKK